MTRKRIQLKAVLIALMISGTIAAQERVIDKVIAVVGSNPILKSELEAQYHQMVAQQEPVDGNTRCKLLEDLHRRDCDAAAERMREHLLRLQKLYLAEVAVRDRAVTKSS